MYRNLGRQIWNFSTHCSANNKPHGVLGNSSPWWKPTDKWQMGATSSEMNSISNEYRPQTYRFFLVKAGHWQINSCIFFRPFLETNRQLGPELPKVYFEHSCPKGRPMLFLWPMTDVKVICSERNAMKILFKKALDGDKCLDCFNLHKNNAQVNTEIKLLFYC